MERFGFPCSSIISLSFINILGKIKNTRFWTQRKRVCVQDYCRANLLEAHREGDQDWHALQFRNNNTQISYPIHVQTSRKFDNLKTACFLTQMPFHNKKQHNSSIRWTLKLSTMFECNIDLSSYAQMILLMMYTKIYCRYCNVSFQLGNISI